MQELSLNILDIAENSVKAGASLITVAVCYRPAADRLTVTITDDGCGMDAETVRRVCDPFYTTRTTRRVGMGLPLWKMAAEMTGGAMTVESVPGAGTTVTAVFGLSHIDRLPLGDLPQTMATLIGAARKRTSGWNLTMMGRGSRPIPGSTARCWGRRSPWRSRRCWRLLPGRWPRG